MKVLAIPFNKSNNPYLSLLYSNLSKSGVCVYRFSLSNLFKYRFDVVHIHWPESDKFRYGFFKAFLYVISFNLSLLFLKLKGSKIVWTVHNFKPHDLKYPILLNVHFSIFTKSVDAYIVMIKDCVNDLRLHYPSLRNKPFNYIPHGHYRDLYSFQSSRDVCRQSFGFESEDFVFLLVGHLRAYKNVDRLIEVFSEAKNPNFKLLIAGKLDEDIHFQSKVFNLASLDNRIVLKPGFIGDDDLHVYFNASNVVVLPYKELFNSGAMLLALSFNRPVLLPRNSVSEEYLSEFGESFVNLYNDLVPDIFGSVSDKHERVDPFLAMQSRDWGVIGKETFSFFNKVVNRH